MSNIIDDYDYVKSSDYVFDKEDDLTKNYDTVSQWIDDIGWIKF